MCGIWLLFTKKHGFDLTDGSLYNAFMRIKKRGPDNSYYKTHDQIGLTVGFHRLAINETRNISADQPFVVETANSIYYAICNGEIYNYKELAQKYDIQLISGSDCEILIPLFQKIGMDTMMKEIKTNGEFAVIICEIDKTTHDVKISAGRDKCGIRPLFIANSEDTVVFSSELKGIPFLRDNEFKVCQFSPRHHVEISAQQSFSNLTFTEYFNFNNIAQTVTDFEKAKALIRNSLINAVEARMLCDRELGCLLSGGLDSSIVASIIAAYYRKYHPEKKLRTFCIAIEKDATDVKFSQYVADHIGSIHTIIIIPEKEWLNAIEKVIYTIESYDITSVRASTGQYLVSKWISQNTNIKVLQVGDGSDECSGGYLYTLKAPSKDAFDQESKRLVNDIHFFDGLRGDRCIAESELEGRFPFLGEFAEVYFTISAELRKPSGQFANVEKYLLREAFRDTGYLPDEVLFRRKEAFSDGVSTTKRSWFSILQENINKMYTDDEFIERSTKYTHNRPPSKEALYYREVFEKHFGTREEVAKVIPYFWLPKWCGEISEPSARILEHYDQ